MGAKVPLNREYHNAGRLISPHFEDHPLKYSFKALLRNWSGRLTYHPYERGQQMMEIN
jgi:hypothetical protein